MSDTSVDWPDHHVAQIGRVALSWNQASYAVYQIFQQVSGMSVAMAWDAFWALKADSTQRDITLAVTNAAFGANDALSKSLKSLFNQLGKAAGERNAIVHTPWGMTVLDTGAPNPADWKDVVPMRLTHPKNLLEDFDTQCRNVEDRLEVISVELMRLNVRIHQRLNTEKV